MLSSIPKSLPQDQQAQSVTSERRPPDSGRLAQLIEKNRQQARNKPDKPPSGGLKSNTGTASESAAKAELEQLRLEHARAQQEHLKEKQRLHEKIVELEERSSAHLREKTGLQSELIGSKKECRQTAERERALRVALDRASVAGAGSSEKAQKYALLQRKVDDLERVHEEGKINHEAELDRLQKELHAARAGEADLAAALLDQREGNIELDALVRTLQVNAARDHAEMEQLRRQVLAANDDSEKVQKEVEDLTSRVKVEKTQHNATERQLSQLRVSLEASETRREMEAAELRAKLVAEQKRVATVEDKRSQLKTASAALAQKFQEQAQHLSDCLMTIQALSSLHGNLVASSVGRTTHEATKTSLALSQLAECRLSRLLADRDAEVEDLSDALKYVTAENACLRSSLTEAEDDLKTVLAEQTKDNTEVTVSLWLDASATLELYAELHSLRGDIAQTSAAVSKMEIATLQTSIQVSDGRFKEVVATAIGLANTAHQSALDSTALQRNISYLETRIAAAEASASSSTALQLATASALENTRTAFRTAEADWQAAELNLRRDLGEAENRLADQMERAKEKDKFVLQIRMGEDSLNADIESLVHQLEVVSRYKEAYETLMREVDMLVSKNSLAENEAARLSSMNAEILSHGNPGQRIFYVEKIRKELAEAKQMLIATAVQRDEAETTRDRLTGELAMYKSIVVPIVGKPKTIITRVQRAPLASSTRDNATEWS